MKRCIGWRGPLAALALMPSTVPVHADHALTQTGLGLFNVRVEANTTTWSRPLRIVHKPESFQYDYSQNEVLPLLQKTSVQWISDYETTSVGFGKQEARSYMEERGWHLHEPPPPVHLVPPTPAPDPTPTPTPTPTPDPDYFADQTKPLAERIGDQMNLFLAQQASRSSELRLAVNFKNKTAEEAKQDRIRLVEDQIRILQAYYPMDEKAVQNALRALQEQAETVRQTGKYSHEA